MHTNLWIYFLTIILLPVLTIAGVIYWLINKLIHNFTGLSRRINKW